jgi:hypothetical protein
VPNGGGKSVLDFGIEIDGIRTKVKFATITIQEKIVIFKNYCGIEVSMVKAYFQIFSILTTLISSLFLLKGIIGITPKDLAIFSSINNGHKLELINAFSQQSAYIKIGFALGLLAFSLQLLQTYFPVSIFSQLKNWRLIVYAISSALVVSLCAYFIADIMAINLAKEVIEIHMN